MKLSARNQLPATIKSLLLGGVRAEVILEREGGAGLVSAIARASAEKLELKGGMRVMAAIKATDVIVGRA